MSIKEKFQRLSIGKAFNSRGAYSQLLDKDGQLYSSPNSKLWQLVTLLCITHLLLTSTTLFFAQRYFVTKYSMDLSGTSDIYLGIDRTLVSQPFSLFNPDGNSKYTDTPGPAVDRAWHQLGLKESTFLLSADLGGRHGLNPQEFMYVKKGIWHEEKEGYPVSLQAIHDLHCVNMLRKSLYYNYDYYTQYIDHEKEPEQIRKSHINHCVDALRERVMCTADMGVIPFGWSRPGEGAKPYFGMKHKCHHFDDVLQWALRNAEDWNTSQIDVPVPPDAKFGVVGW